MSLRPTESAPDAQGDAAGRLYLVGTPIGNLEDITLRALRILKEVDLIACEDTRQTRKLLNHYEIRKPTLSYHEHNELTRASELVGKLEEGARIALVSDAGMPLISDPGYRLVSLAIRHHVPRRPHLRGVGFCGGSGGVRHADGTIRLSRISPCPAICSTEGA